MSLLEQYKRSLSEMVAGDSVDISSGTTTGDIVSKGPETLPAKKKKSKVNKDTEK